MSKFRVSRRRMAKQLENMNRLFAYFGDNTLEELDRVAKIPSGIDGWPSGGSGSGGSGDADPTLLAVVRRLSTKPNYDHRQVSAETAAKALEDAHTSVQCAYRALLVFKTTAEEKRGRETSLAECGCCSSSITGIGNDRLRANYCPACYAAWYRSKKAGMSDRVRFETARKAQLQAEIADEAQ